MKYHNLTVENEHIGFNRFNHRLWLCRCDCGIPVVVDASSVRTGRTKSCGCLRVAGASNRKHGQRSQNGKGVRSKVYAAWCNMKQRCSNQNSPQYHDYGGRGITYDPRWKDDFEAFHDDVGDPPDQSFTLDRIDVDGPYSKENVRWADLSTQRRNKRPESKGGRLVWCEIEGERLILADAIKKYGVVPYQTATCRIHQGWTPEDAVLTPYTRGFKSAPVTSGARYTYNGKTQTLSAWSRELGIGRVTLLKRLQRGVPIDLAFSTAGYLSINKRS